MQNLLIEQRGPHGLLKTWRLRSEQGVVTFGCSKHADLRSPLEGIKGIQGLFEYRGDKWYYVNLDLHTQHPQMTAGGSDFCIDQPTEVRVGVISLTVTPFDAKLPLFSQLDQADIIRPGQGRHPYQLFTVFAGHTVLQTKVIPVHQTFSSKFDTTKTKFTPERSEQWKRTEVGALTISQRTVYLTDVEALKHVTMDQLVDDGGRKSLIATLSASALLGLLFILSPKQNSLDEVLTPLPPKPLVMKEIKMEKPKKQPEQSAPKEPTPQKAQQVAAAPKTGGGASKAASLIKNLGSGRITQLVGKVSAAAAKSSNVVVTSGVAAGTKPTGRALAALGSLSKSGKDWSAEGKGTGITISTKGKAGGVGTAGMGTLALGKTGQGGVGLLEDESEIVGGLDREVIAAYIRSQLGQILYCYERQLSAQPDLYGKVAVKFTIAGDGTIETQRIGDTTLKNATVEGCILQRVAKWKFPTPEGGTKVMVTYPFLFKSTN